jgi:hypothetical protein
MSKKASTRPFVAWLSENEAKFAEHAPEGSEYLGIYFTVFTSEKDSGTCETLWRFESYSAIDHFQAVEKEGSEIGRLMAEVFSTYADEGNHANWSRSLTRRAGDAVLYTKGKVRGT